MHKPYLAESYRREFIIEMQAKGKLPKVATEATDRRDKGTSNTGSRVFPRAWGTEAVLEKLITQSTERIDAVQHAVPKGVPSAEAAGNCAPKTGRTGRGDPAARTALKAKLAHLEAELLSERATRLRVEEQISALVKASATP